VLAPSGEAQVDAPDQEDRVMSEAFHMGGWGMYPTLVFGLMLIAASIRYAVSPERRFVPLQVSLGMATLAAGGLGFVTGMIKSTMAIGDVGPDKRWIWVLGMGESLNCAALALVLIVVGALAASVGGVRLAQQTQG
jgi:hypothetical protein